MYRGVIGEICLETEKGSLSGSYNRLKYVNVSKIIAHENFLFNTDLAQLRPILAHTDLIFVTFLA